MSPSRRGLPSGTVTFLFTDVEGSTKLLRDLGPEGYAEALADHRRVFRRAFKTHHGVEVDTQGDAFFAVFVDAAGAVAAATEALNGLAIPVRMGLHTGRPLLTEDGYVGIDVNLGARIAACGAGGQVLLSEAATGLIDAQVSDLGEHRLKDIVGPVRIFQLGEESFPPLKTISNTNLPRPASSFIGRETEVAAVQALLEGGARLVTVSGPGGSGKTRLAIEAAAGIVQDFRAGVFWVGLPALREADLVSQAIERVLGAGDDLASHIGEREMLLVLDNFEQVIEAAPQLGRLLSACPSLRLIVTSRERLRIDGEIDYRVPPLAGSEASELFCARSGQERDGTIDELCRRLDSLPLAVELAASRVSVLAPAQILERLSNRLDLFTGGRDADPRQTTLRATIEWSHDLLTQPEQALFARLAVFAGGCTLGAAEEIAAAALDTLQSLVEKSLVRHSDDRFWMLETIRDFALEQLAAAGEMDVAGLRHAQLYLAVAESSGFAHDSRSEERYDLVASELANLRAALQWSLDADPGLGLQLAMALEFYWLAVSPFEGRRWFEALLARTPDLRLEVRAPATKCLGGMIWIVGEWDEGRAYYDEASSFYRELGDASGIAIMHPRVAADLQRRGDLDQARILCNQALDRHRREGFEKGEAEALLILSYIARQEGNLEGAIELSDRSARLAQKVGFLWWQIGCREQSAECSLLLGRPDEARWRALEALRISDTIAGRQWIISALSLLAWAAVETQDVERAGRLWGAIEAEAERGRIGQWESEREDRAKQLAAVAGPEFDRAVRKGKGLTLDAAVKYALAS